MCDGNPVDAAGKPKNKFLRPRRPLKDRFGGKTPQYLVFQKAYCVVTTLEQLSLIFKVKYCGAVTISVYACVAEFAGRMAGLDFTWRKDQFLFDVQCVYLATVLRSQACFRTCHFLRVRVSYVCVL
jgi:hypothetical protein